MLPIHYSSHHQPMDHHTTAISLPPPIIHVTQRGQKRGHFSDVSSRAGQSTLDHLPVTTRLIHPLKQAKRAKRSVPLTPPYQLVATTASVSAILISPGSSPVKRQRTMSVSSSVQGIVLDSEVDSEGRVEKMDICGSGEKRRPGGLSGKDKAMNPSPLQKSFSDNTNTFDFNTPLLPDFTRPSTDMRHFAARRVFKMEQINRADGEGAGVEMDKVFQMFYGRAKGMGDAGERKGRGSGLKPREEDGVWLSLSLSSEDGGMEVDG